MGKGKKDKKIKELNKKIEKYEKLIKRLFNELEKKDKVHNERGAGRKPKFNKEEIEEIQKYRLKGNTIRDIAKEFKCSVGLIHKIINNK